MSAVISVSGLWKEYIIGAREQRHDTFYEKLASGLKNPFRRYKQLAGEVAPEERFWALKDMSFEIKEGEVVGIIGRNGAGKSTLLKILSRITEPTRGRVMIRGRVASLLEVGTGFHPELTGRENIFLNGAILGMTRRDIEKRFDEIVAFAGVEQFLDTPIKRYSSGMYVRLAFAVAAHLEPDVLLVDEVLAVGDAEFQRKSVTKMNEVSSQGRTVIFVSHNMGSIKQLCNRAIWFDCGRIVQDGKSGDVTLAYLSSCIETGATRRSHVNKAITKDDIAIYSVVISDAEGRGNFLFGHDVPLLIKINYELTRPINGFSLCVRLNHCEWGTIFQTCDGPRDANRMRPSGKYISTIKIPGRLLKSGQYTVGVSVDVPFHRILLVEENLAFFQVHGTEPGREREEGIWPGIIDPFIEWQIASVSVTQN